MFLSRLLIDCLVGKKVRKMVKWYLDNQTWMDNVTSGDYQQYYNTIIKEDKEALRA